MLHKDAPTPENDQHEEIILWLAKIHSAIERLADPPEFFRASGEVYCHLCNEQYWRHPVHPYYKDLHMLCEGKLVKL